MQEIFIGIWNKPLVSLIYLFSGIAIVLLAAPRKTYALPSLRIPRLSYVIGLSFLALAFVPSLSEFLIDNPLDYKKADMLPIIQIMSDRFISGENPYQLITEIWDDMQPIYLPMMWLPFTIAEVFSFDLRWVSYACIILGCLSFSLFGLNTKKVGGWEILALVPIALILYKIVMGNQYLLYHTEEPVVICYYLLLGAALVHQRYLWIAFAIACCVMSRYSLLLWVVMYFFYIFFYKEKRTAITYCLISCAIVLVLMSLTNAIHYIEVFAGLSGEYIASVTDPALAWHFKPLVESKLGMGKFFQYENLNILHQVFLILSVAIPAICLMLFHKFRSKINDSLFPLLSLKLCLVFFYNFIIIPYSYLFYVSTFLSIGILYAYLSEDKISIEQSRSPVLQKS